MKLRSALLGLVAIFGVALSTNAASAMPIAPLTHVTNVEQAAYACNGWGHCWWRPNYAYGDEGQSQWRWHRWHHWHQWHRWHQWRHWHQWHHWNHWHRWHHWHNW